MGLNFFLNTEHMRLEIKNATSSSSFHVILTKLHDTHPSDGEKMNITFLGNLSIIKNFMGL